MKFKHKIYNLYSKNLNCSTKKLSTNDVNDVFKSLIYYTPIAKNPLSNVYSKISNSIENFI